VQWLNIQITDLHSEQFLGSDPTDRATWLALLGYCASQENGGTIDGACSWSDRMCQQVLGVTKDELDSPTQLWTFTDDCVTVWAYPVDQEAAVQAKRDGGKLGGLRRARNLKPKPQAEPVAMLKAKPQGELEGMLEANLQRKGKEGKGKKGKDVASAYPVDFEEFWKAYPKKKGKGAALKAWKMRSGLRPIQTELMKTVRALAASTDWTKDGGKWVPNPATWLNADGWCDEIMPTTASTTTPDTLVTSTDPNDWKME
jgi:hypothetical protein